MHLIKYDTGDKIYEVESDGNKSVLDSLIDSGVDDINYMCRDGYCGYCKCDKGSGEVYYKEEPMVILKNNEFLPCVAIPRGDVVFKSILSKKAWINRLFFIL